MNATLEELTPDELATLERYRKERDSDNEYTPWIELGTTELEYFKLRYLEARAETMAVMLAADTYLSVLSHNGMMPDNMTTDGGTARRAYETARERVTGARTTHNPAAARMGPVGG